MAPFQSSTLYETLSRLNRWQTVSSVERMWRGSYCIYVRTVKKNFFLLFLDVDLDPGYESLSSTLIHYTVPTERCGGFLSKRPDIEVRIQV